MLTYVPRWAKRLQCSGAAIIFISFANGDRAQAQQVTIPPMPLEALGRSTQPLLAGEAAYHIAEAEHRQWLAASVMVKYPVDSIQREVAQVGRVWLARIAPEIHGIQEDPAIQVLVAAGDTMRAKQLIAKRVSRSALPLADKALTYRTAVKAFANQAYPERLPDAEYYLRQLDALGDSAVFWRYQAHKTLMHVYFSLGRSADVRRLGRTLIDLVPHLAYNDRQIVFGDLDWYNEYVAALTGEHDSAPLIAHTNATLEASTKAPETWVALDPEFRRLEADFRDKMRWAVSANALLGKSAHPLVAHVWLNRTGSDSVLPVNDGKVRVIELANTSCAQCIAGLQMIQRLQHRYPAIETVFLTYTYGYWGNRLVSADEEVPHIAEFLNTRAKITMPAGIWKSRITANEDGGQSIESRGPNFDHYPTFKMSVWVIDGRGVIRRYFESLDRRNEDELTRVIEFLTREGTVHFPASPAS